MMAGDMAYLMRQGASKLTLGFHKIEQPAVHEDESTRQVGCVDRGRVDHLGSEGHAWSLGFGPQSLHDAAHVSGKQGGVEQDDALLVLFRKLPAQRDHLGVGKSGLLAAS